MGYNSVDFSELKEYCNNFKTTQEAFALDCESLRLKFKAFKEMESFQGKAAVSAKNQVEQVEDVLLNAIDKAANVYNSQLQAMRIDFSIVVDPADVVRADEGVLLDLNKRIKEVHHAFFNTSKGICSRVDVLRANYPDYIITKPKYGSAIRDFEKLAGASGYSGSGLVHEGGMVNQQWKDMAYFDRAHYGDLADIDLNSLCDKIEKILTESEQSSTDTDISKNINEFDTNIFSVNKEMVDGLQEFCDSLDPAAAYAAQLVEMYKAELILKDENGDWILNINKIQEIMKQAPSEIPVEQYLALIALFSTLDEDRMEKFIGASYEYKSDEYVAYYQLSEVFTNMAGLYIIIAKNNMDKMERSELLGGNRSEDAENILEQLSRAALLVRLSQIGRKVESSLNSIQPKYFEGGQPFLPVDITIGSTEYHDYYVKYFPNFLLYPMVDFSSVDINIYGFRSDYNIDSEITDEENTYLGKNIKSWVDVLGESAFGEMLDYGAGKVAGANLILKATWIGGKFVVSYAEAEKENYVIGSLIEANKFKEYAKALCIDMQFSVANDQFYLDYFDFNEKELQWRINYYNKENGTNVRLDNIKEWFKDVTNGKKSENLNKFCNWWTNGEYPARAKEYENDMKETIKEFAKINLNKYKDKKDDYCIEGVPISVVRKLQKALKKAEIRINEIDEITVPTNIITIGNDILVYIE